MSFFIKYTNFLTNEFKELWCWETKERTRKHLKLIKNGKQKELIAL